MYTPFVDLEKAFKNVDCNKVFIMIRNNGFKYRGRRIISTIFQDQMAAIKTDKFVKVAVTKKGVNRGCS